jgi:hypothetical protein
MEMTSFQTDDRIEAYGRQGTVLQPASPYSPHVRVRLDGNEYEDWLHRDGLKKLVEFRVGRSYRSKNISTYHYQVIDVHTNGNALCWVSRDSGEYVTGTVLVNPEGFEEIG